MNIREYLVTVASLYASTEPFDSPGQAVLRAGAPIISRMVPAGFIVKAGGGKGRTTHTPWIGVLDPDETVTPQSGIYIVYIFSATLDMVSLTLLQGTDVGHHKPALTRAELREDATEIRAAMAEQEALKEYPRNLSLKTSNSRQKRYEQATIAAKTYACNDLPSAEELEFDFKTMLSLYREAIDAKRRLLLTSPGSVHAPALPQETAGTEPFREFKPKDASDYQQAIRGRRIKKTRGHEALIREFGEYASDRGLVPATNVHPCDLTLLVRGVEWLVEAKTVGSQPAAAVRAAIGQLFEYEYMLYSRSSRLQKVALFSDTVGPAFVELLESLGIAAIWKESGRWRASRSAAAIVPGDQRIEVSARES